LTFRSISVRKNLKVIDLFAGAGGFSLGAERAGMHIVSSVEIDPHANETHSRNFPRSIHLGTSVAELTGKQLLSSSGLKPGELDGLIGGPPCQGFSTIGKRNPQDKRNDLFGHFMRLVAETQPRFFIAENVPGILQERNRGILERALTLVPDNYDMAQSVKICAADYGAPTIRTRVFFIGIKKNEGDLLSCISLVNSRKKLKTTVSDALVGLPAHIDPNWQSDESSWQKVDTLSPSFFNTRAQGRVPARVGDKFALDAFFESGYTSGCFGTHHAEVIAKRYGDLNPRQQDMVSKSIRLDLHGFCPTLRAGTGSDKGSYQAVRPIHPTMPRVITPREAARLQGFPDWFLLHPTKWHSFRQLGNSVSPILAEHILKAVGNNIH
jgi:DNA (cytosine-5)-methyltransferase 1